jgi:hypothetical protein
MTLLRWHQADGASKLHETHQAGHQIRFLQNLNHRHDAAVAEVLRKKTESKQSVGQTMIRLLGGGERKIPLDKANDDEDVLPVSATVIKPPMPDAVREIVRPKWSPVGSLFGAVWSAVVLLFRLVKGLLTLPVLVLRPLASLLLGGSWGVLMLKALALYVAAALGLHKYVVQAEEKSTAEQTHVNLLKQEIVAEVRPFEYSSASEKKRVQLAEMRRRAAEKERSMQAFDRQLREQERQAQAYAMEMDNRRQNNDYNRQRIVSTPAPRSVPTRQRNGRRDADRDSTFSSAQSVNDDFINRSPEGYVIHTSSTASSAVSTLIG